MKIIKHSEIKESIQGFDLFLCSSSFENRCLEIAKNIDIIQFKNIVICHFENNYPEAEQNLIKLQEIFCQRKDITMTKSNPLINYDKLYDYFTSCDFSYILFDISTFTRENFLMILQLFKQEPFKDKILTLCYNPSDKYSSVSDDDMDKLWLSKGVQNIRAVLGYSGDFSPIKKLLLVVLVGFEAERAQIVINNFEPALLYLGKAPEEKSKNTEIAKINEHNFKKLINLNPNARQFDFSCMDFQPTIKALSEIIEQHKNEYNIVISPMCNKISTLAVASTVFKYPEVQICYASTNLYNTDAYSTPSDFIYLIEFDEL
jgi:hypothetical protein